MCEKGILHVKLTRITAPKPRYTCPCACLTVKVPSIAILIELKQGLRGGLHVVDTDDSKDVPGHPDPLLP